MRATKLARFFRAVHMFMFVPQRPYYKQSRKAMR